jgi:hypothetical protein
MTTPAEARAKYIADVSAVMAVDFPDTTSKQRLAVANAILDRGEWNITDDLKIVKFDVWLHTASNPAAVRTPPTAEQACAYLISAREQEHKAMGRVGPLDPESKLVAFRTVQAMDADARLAAVPASYTPPAAVAPAVATGGVPVGISKLPWQEQNLRLEQHFGGCAADLLPSRRATLLTALAAQEAKPVVAAAPNTQSAEFLALSPAERITRYRESQASGDKRRQ